MLPSTLVSIERSVNTWEMKEKPGMMNWTLLPISKVLEVISNGFVGHYEINISLYEQKEFYWQKM